MSEIIVLAGTQSLIFSFHFECNPEQGGWRHCCRIRGVRIEECSLARTGAKPKNYQAHCEFKATQMSPALLLFICTNRPKKFFMFFSMPKVIFCYI